MNRLLILTLVAVVPVASGCCRSWPRRFMYRGDACSCATTYDAAPVYEGSVLPAQMIPGPSLPIMPGPEPAPVTP